MGKRNELRGCSRANGAKCGVKRGERGRHRWELDVPQFGSGCAVPDENREVVVGDCDRGRREGDGATRITELSHGKERERG